MSNTSDPTPAEPIDYGGPDPSVECAYPPCFNRLRRSPDFDHPQWCSKSHRTLTEDPTTAAPTPAERRAEFVIQSGKFMSTTDELTLNFDTGNYQPASQVCTECWTRKPRTLFLDDDDVCYDCHTEME